MWQALYRDKKLINVIQDENEISDSELLAAEGVITCDNSFDDDTIIISDDDDDCTQEIVAQRPSVIQWAGSIPALQSTPTITQLINDIIESQPESPKEPARWWEHDNSQLDDDIHELLSNQQWTADDEEPTTKRQKLSETPTQELPIAEICFVCGDKIHEGTCPLIAECANLANEQFESQSIL